MLFTETAEDEYSRDKVDVIAENLYAYYEDPNAYHVFPDFFEFADRIKLQKQKLIAISNFDNRLINILSNLKINHFTNIITSESANSSKPEKEIFRQSVKNLHNVHPQNILHVGDDVAKDYYGARDMGWHALLMSRNGNINDKNIQHDNICKDFHDVTHWLQNQ